MARIAEVRDWLSQLRVLLEAGDIAGSKRHVVEIVRARPDLEGAVCAVAGEYLEEADARLLWAEAVEIVSAAVVKPEPFVEEKVIDWAAERARRKSALETVAEPAVEAEVEPEQEAKEEPEPGPKAEPKAALRLIVAGVKPQAAAPGIVGEIAEFATASAMYPSMKFATALGIGVTNTLISRRVAGPTGPRGCATHLYQALIGPTGIGKEHNRTVGKLLMSTAGAAALIGPGRFKSGPGLVRYVEGHPVMVCFMDELGGYFARLADPRASGYEREITEALREFWGLGWGRYDSAMGMVDESKVVMCPQPSLIGLTTPKELFRACRSRDVANGYLNRWNFVEEREMPDWQKTDEASLDVPKGLAVGLRKLYRPVSLLDWDGKPQERLKFGPGAEDVYHAVRESVERETDERRRELGWRSPEKTVRVATGIAAGAFSPVVTRPYMEWAWDWVREGDETLIAGVNEYGEEEKLEFGELCREVVRRIRRNGAKWTVDLGEGPREVVGMIEREVGRSFQNNLRYKRDLKDALDHLNETGQLGRTNLNAGGMGRPSHLLWLGKISE